MQEYKLGEGSPIEHVAALLNQKFSEYEKDGWKLFQVLVVPQIIPVKHRIINGSRNNAGPQIMQMGFPLLVREKCGQTGSLE